LPSFRPSGTWLRHSDEECCNWSVSSLIRNDGFSSGGRTPMDFTTRHSNGYNCVLSSNNCARRSYWDFQSWLLLSARCSPNVDFVIDFEIHQNLLLDILVTCICYIWIRFEMAMNCVDLTAIQIPASIEVLCLSCFVHCKSLISVTFKMDSTLHRIEDSAFAGSGLTSIQVPASVEVLCKSCFSNCMWFSLATF
jgi:hypothetical protein